MQGPLTFSVITRCAMFFLQSVEKIIRLVRLILEAMIILLFSFMTLLVFSQVWVRFLTDHSLTWSEELSRFTLIWLIYIASIITYGDRAHIIVDALVVALKGRLRVVAQLISHICVVIFTVLVGLGAMELMPTTAMQTSAVNKIVMSNVYIIIPISMFFMAIIAVKEIFLAAIKLKEPKRADI